MTAKGVQRVIGIGACLAVVLGCGPLAAVGCQGAPERGRSLCFRVLEVNLNGVPVDQIAAGKRVFRSRQEWEDFFNRFNVRPEPGVEFDKEIIAAVFLGEQPGPGYGLEVEWVAKIADLRETRTLVKLREILPDPKLGSAAVVTYPRIFIALPKDPDPVLFCSCQHIERREP